MEPENTPNYFTKELEDKIRNLSDNEMFRLMLALEQSEYWVPLLRYNQIRMGYTQSAILAADPVKEPTSIARNQGVMLGLSDFQNAVIMIKQERDSAAAEAEKPKDDDGTDVE